MEKHCDIDRKCFSRTFVTGLLMSAVLLMLEYFSIIFMHKYMPESFFMLFGMTVVCFVLFWIFVKYDRYLEMNDVFRKTISFHDFNLNNAGLTKLFIRYVRPLNPYIGILGTLSALFFVLCAVPAAILYWTVNSGRLETWLQILVVFMSAGMSALYLFSNRNAFSSILDKCIFLLGILFGTLGTVYIFL